MKTRTASSIENGVPITGTTTLAITAQPTNIMNLEGYCGGTAGTTYFLQLVAVAAPTTTVTVPLWSKAVIGGQGFSFTYNPNGVNTSNLTAPPNTDAVYAIFSTTEDVFTSTSFNSDVEVDYEEYEQQVDSGVQTATASSTDRLTVWTDDYSAPNNPPHTSYNLLSVTVTNGTASPLWVMLFTSAGQVSLGAVPLAQLNVPAGASSTALSSGAPTGELAVGDSYTWKFGGTGRSMFSFDSSAVPHGGCYVYCSSTAGTYTIITASNTITATYDQGNPQ